MLNGEIVGEIEVPVFVQSAPVKLSKDIEDGLKKSDVIWVGTEAPNGRRRTVPAWFAYKNGKIYVLSQREPGPDEQTIPGRAGRGPARGDHAAQAPRHRAPGVLRGAAQARGPGVGGGREAARRQAEEPRRRAGRVADRAGGRRPTSSSSRPTSRSASLSDSPDGRRPPPPLRARDPAGPSRRGSAPAARRRAPAPARDARRSSRASAPAATEASAIGATRSCLPTACDGSTITGRCVSACATAIPARSSVLRVDGSNVRMPRSHRMISELPRCATYSAACSHSSIVIASPRFSITGLWVCRPPSAARSSARSGCPRGCSRRPRRRAPPGETSTTSTMIGRPVSRRHSARISSPRSPSPWNEYGDVRGL